MKRTLLLLSAILISSLQVRSQMNYYVRAHKADTVIRVSKESFHYNKKIYFISKENDPLTPGPILNICDSNGVNLRTVALPWTSFSIGNYEFRNGNFLYATQNSVYRIDTLGNVVWHSYIQNNCAGGGSVVHSKFLKNGNIIVFGVSNSNLVIIRLDPVTGLMIGNAPITISMNSANPSQVPSIALNTYVNDCLELSNSSLYFLLTRRDNTATYTENYVLKCANDTTFNVIKGIEFDNVITNNFNTYPASLNSISSYSNELVLSGADYSSGITNLSLLKIDTLLTVIPTRYPKIIKNLGSTLYSYNPAISTNHNKLYYASTNAPNGCEIALMQFDYNLNVTQWKGYNLDNQSTNLSVDCSIPQFMNAGSNGNKLYSIVSYSNPLKFTRSILKTDMNGSQTCSIALTPTISVDSLHSSLIATFNGLSGNSSSTFVATYTVLNMYADSLMCNSVILGVKNEQLFDAVSIYPNPVNALLSIKGNNIISEIKVMNSLGQVVLEKHELNSESAIIELDSFASGFYLVKVKIGHEVFIKKVLKE